MRRQLVCGVRRLIVALALMATAGYLLAVSRSNHFVGRMKMSVDQEVGPPEPTGGKHSTGDDVRRGSALRFENNTNTFYTKTSAELMTKPPTGRKLKVETIVNDDPAKCSEALGPRRPKDGDVIYRHKYWQVANDGVEDIVLFSAFYDNRPIVGALPWLRILGVRKRCSASNQQLFCQIWYPTELEPFVVKADVIATGRDNGVAGGLVYSQRQFSCQLPDAERVPSHVSLVISRCSIATTLLPVIVPEKSPVAGRWLHEFSLCAEVNFGSIPAFQAVEWIELNAMFGVSRFYIYNGNITDATTVAVMEYYAHQGLVQFIPMPPSVEDYSLDGVRLASPASFNDCMMRSMYTSRFVVVIDLDEVIVPRLHSNYSELIDHVDRTLQLKQSYHTYSFRNTYFFTYFPQDDTQPSFLRTARLRFRAPPSPYLFGAKSFVDPRRCLSVFNHYCWVRFRDGNDPRFGLSVDVPPDVALSHHYRGVCPEGFGKEQCNGYDRDKVKDDIILKFRPVLEKRVRAVLDILRLL